MQVKPVGAALKTLEQQDDQEFTQYVSMVSSTMLGCMPKSWAGYLFLLGRGMFGQHSLYSFISTLK
jgi:hypothetical protein